MDRQTDMMKLIVFFFSRPTTIKGFLTSPSDHARPIFPSPPLSYKLIVTFRNVAHVPKTYCRLWRSFMHTYEAWRIPSSVFRPRTLTADPVSSSHHLFTPAFEDGTDRVFRNVGIYKSEAGESPKRNQTKCNCCL